MSSTGPSSISIYSRLREDKFQEHARWIAIIVAEWAVLESELEGVYGAVLNLEYHRSKIAFYAVQSHPAKRDIISAAIEELFHGTAIEKMWKDLQNDLRSASKIRNRIAHAIWAEHPTRHELQMRSTNVAGTYSQPRKLYQISSLRNNAADIASVAGRLNEIQAATRAVPPPPSPRRLAELSSHRREKTKPQPATSRDKP